MSSPRINSNRAVVDPGSFGWDQIIDAETKWLQIL